METLHILISFSIIGLIKLIYDFIITICDYNYLKNLELNIISFKSCIENKKDSSKFNSILFKMTLNFIKTKKQRYYKICSSNFSKQYNNSFSAYETMIYSYNQIDPTVTLNNIKFILEDIQGSYKLIGKRIILNLVLFLIVPLYPLFGFTTTAKIILSTFGYYLNKRLVISLYIIGFALIGFSCYSLLIQL